MIVQKHKHLNGLVAVMRFRRSGYDVFLEETNPQTKSVSVICLERFMKHHEACNWMENQRKKILKF